MIRKIYLIIFFMLTPIVSMSMNTALIKPANTLPKVQSVEPNYAEFNIEYTHGRADTSFTEHSKSVPLLAWNGTEKLLNRIVYPEDYAYNDTTSVGTAYLDADHATINELALHASKNFKNGLFVAGSLLVTDVKIYDVGLTVIKDTTTGETYPKFIHYPPDEMETDDINLYNWCKEFPFVLGSQGSNKNIRQYNLSNGFLKVGYSKKIEELHALESFHFTLAGGIMTPELYDNYLNEGVHLPLGEKSNIGLFAEGNILISKNKYLNFGVTGSFMAFINQVTDIPLTTTETNNTFFENNVELTKVARKPFTHFNIYYQAERIFDHLSILLGYSYTQQRELVYTSLDEEKYPTALINKYSVNKEGWESGSIHLEIEYDLNSEENPNKPILSFSYSRPIAGSKIFISKMLAGSCSFNFSYKF